MIVTWTDLELIRADYPNLCLGYATGTFDLLHGGHLDYLEWAWEQCDLLLVSVRSDQRVRAAKGQDRPVIDQTARAQAIDTRRQPAPARRRNYRQRLAARGAALEMLRVKTFTIR